MKTSKCFFAALALAAALVACKKEERINENPGTEQSGSQDVTFALQASTSNALEVSMGRLAAQMATNSGVRAFGTQMAAEHTEAQNQLQVAANNARISTNFDTTGMNAMRQQLAGLTGRAFDSTYITMQIAAHQQTLSLLQTEVSAGLSPSLKNYAAMQIPHVQMHLQVADSLRRNL